MKRAALLFAGLMFCGAAAAGDCGGAHYEGRADGAHKAKCEGGGETAYIVGSAEHPDPVLQEVLRLQDEGAARDVQIMESFPVQIRLTACPDIISQLEGMPRKGRLE